MVCRRGGQPDRPGGLNSLFRGHGFSYRQQGQAEGRAEVEADGEVEQRQQQNGVRPTREEAITEQRPEDAGGRTREEEQRSWQGGRFFVAGSPLQKKHTAGAPLFPLSPCLPSQLLSNLFLAFLLLPQHVQA
jgi:hypothetical protein